jgi:hypothetical protein
MTVRKTGDAHKVLWESARSILSMEKAKVSML